MQDKYDFLQDNGIPGIDTENNDMFPNPTLSSPNSYYTISLYQTRETLVDPEIYRAFLKNAIRTFQTSKTYKGYKSQLHELGLDRCAIHGNITAEMATLEMHHNILSIMDIAIIITEHVLNTRGKISTFDLVTLLKQEHANNRVALVMLSVTPHEMYHNSMDHNFVIHPDACVGDWVSFLKLYNTGITYDIGLKLLNYINKSVMSGVTDDDGLLEIRDYIKNWSGC